SDIYSLGVIAYEMLAGRPPFTAKRVGDFGVKLLNSKPPSLRAHNPDVNIVIEAEIFRALEKDPMDRPQRALEFRRDVRNALSINKEVGSGEWGIEDRNIVSVRERRLDERLVSFIRLRYNERGRR